MTTIAYKDGIIATDGQITAGDVIVTLNAVKNIQHEMVDFWLCGSEPDIQELVKAWPDGKLDKRNNASGFVLNQGLLFCSCQDDGACVTWEHCKEAAYAFGGGAQFAIGAMDAGLSAADAVSIASGRDIGTGGTVRKYDAATGEEINET